MADKNHFVITGNATTGTSLLCALCNAHPHVACMFEWNFRHKQYDTWFEEREKSEVVWGNKQPIEQMCNNGWNKRLIASLIDEWHIINIYRKFKSFEKRFIKRMRKICHYNGEKIAEAKFWWDLNHRIYEVQREKKPDKIIRVCFEDFVIAPEREATRIFDFLDVDTGKDIVAQAVLTAPKIVTFVKKRDAILPQKAWD